MKAAENGAFARVFIFRTDDGRLGAVAVLPISALIGDGGRVGTGGEWRGKASWKFAFHPGRIWLTLVWQDIVRNRSMWSKSICCTIFWLA